MFKKTREVSRRTREFRALAGGISLEELDLATDRFSYETGLGTGEAMEVGIRFFREIDAVDQSDYHQVIGAYERTQMAVETGELSMVDGKTPIAQVMRSDDFSKMVSLALRWRPIAHMTINAGSSPNPSKGNSTSKYRPHTKGEKHVWAGEECIVCGKAIRFRGPDE